ncbi:MAG: hypothetical protein AB7P03_13380 [Kofleriaceae bacterium]
MLSSSSGSADRTLTTACRRDPWLALALLAIPGVIVPLHGVHQLGVGPAIAAAAKLAGSFLLAFVFLRTAFHDEVSSPVRAGGWSRPRCSSDRRFDPRGRVAGQASAELDATAELRDRSDGYAEHWFLDSSS